MGPGNPIDKHKTRELQYSDKCGDDAPANDEGDRRPGGVLFIFFRPSGMLMDHSSLCQLLNINQDF